MHRERVATEHGTGLCRQRSHDSNPLPTRQRQNPPISQQHDRTPGQLAGQRPALSFIEFDEVVVEGRRFRMPAFVEEAQLAFLGQHPAYSSVYELEGDLAMFDGGVQGVGETVDRRPLDVNPSSQSFGRRFAGTIGHGMQGVQETKQKSNQRRRCPKTHNYPVTNWSLQAASAATGSPSIST